MNAVTPPAGLFGLEPLRLVFDPNHAAFAEGRRTDTNGRLYATTTSTLLVFDR
jgi:hypothetical protein